MEPFSIKKAVDLGGMVWFKAFKTMLVMAMICTVLWSVYVAIIKPHTNPTKTTSQTADQISNTNVEENHYYGIFHLKLGPFEFGI